MSSDLEDIFEGNKRNCLYTIQLKQSDLEGIFKNEIRGLYFNLENAFINNRVNVRFLEDYIEDYMRDLRTNILAKQLKDVEDEFLNNYNLVVREIEEISQMYLEPFELDQKLRAVAARFESNFSNPNSSFIESYFEDFKTDFCRKYNLQDNYDLEFAVTRAIRNSKDHLMEEYYFTIRDFNSNCVEMLGNKINEAKEIIATQNKQIDKIDDVNKNFDPNKPIDTYGKTKEQLLEEQRVLLDKITNDPTIPFEQKVDLHKKIATAYNNAINNIDPQLNGQISIKGKSVKDLEQERADAIDRVMSNPNLEIDAILEEMDRINALYDAAIKSISPIEITDLNGKTQEQLAEEKTNAINNIMQDTTMSDEQKMELYDRVVAQYDEAIAKSSNNVQRISSSLIM